MKASWFTQGTFPTGGAPFVPTTTPEHKELPQAQGLR
jgi:hypothetical protein